MNTILINNQKLQGKSLNQLLGHDLKATDLKKIGNKGDLGLLVEELFFYIKILFLILFLF